MSDRVDLYKRLVTRILAPDCPETPKLSDAAADDYFTRIDEITEAMTEDERREIATWRSPDHETT